MSDFEDLLVFRTDFNNVADDGVQVKTSLYHGFSRRIPRDGERVLLRDSEGNRCWGWVRGIRGVIVFVELDETTWVSGEETRMVPVRSPEGFSVEWATTKRRVPA